MSAKKPQHPPHQIGLNALTLNFLPFLHAAVAFIVSSSFSSRLCIFIVVSHSHFAIYSYIIFAICKFVNNILQFAKYFIDDMQFLYYTIREEMILRKGWHIWNFTMYLGNCD